MDGWYQLNRFIQGWMWVFSSINTCDKKTYSVRIQTWRTFYNVPLTAAATSFYGQARDSAFLENTNSKLEKWWHRAWLWPHETYFLGVFWLNMLCCERLNVWEGTMQQPTQQGCLIKLLAASISRPWWTLTSPFAFWYLLSPCCSKISYP